MLSKLTLDEKIHQLSQVQLSELPDDEKGIEAFFAKNMPGFLCLDFTKDATHNAEKLRKCQEALRRQSRLGIPALTGAEALHGVMVQPCTIYPQAIGLGATWNVSLVQKMAEQIAAEASAIGINQVLSPVLDLGRDPRYGRIEETYGECPTLVSRMGVAFIKGMQGEDATKGLEPGQVYAMTKHFAGYSVPANGINIAPVLVGRGEMLSHHLVPFEAAIRETHAMAVMPSYNSVDGIPSHANPWLLTQLLRDEWGFKGYVYSDWGGIDFLLGHRVAKDTKEAALKAISAGVDLEAPSLYTFKNIPQLIKEKRLSVKVVNEAVRRVLRAKFVAGLFDGKRSFGDADQVKKVVRTEEHIQTSRRLAEEGIILLKNEGNLLPLDESKIKSIAVIGPNAAQVQFGDYSWTKANRNGVHVLQALQQQLAGKLKINYSKGCDLVGLSKEGFAEAVRVVNDSDLAVVVIGDTSMIFSGVGWGRPERSIQRDRWRRF